VGPSFNLSLGVVFKSKSVQSNLKILFCDVIKIWDCDKKYFRMIELFEQKKVKYNDDKKHSRSQKMRKTSSWREGAGVVFGLEEKKKERIFEN
jgi:hypothetical protein